MVGTYEVDPKVPGVYICECSCWREKKAVPGQYSSAPHVRLAVVTVKLAYKLRWNL